MFSIKKEKEERRIHKKSASSSVVPSSPQTTNMEEQFRNWNDIKVSDIIIGAFKRKIKKKKKGSKKNRIHNRDTAVTQI